jgi:hypothetical protein
VPQIRLQAKSLKATLVVDPATVLAAAGAIGVVNGRVELQVAAGERTVSVDIAAKGLRKALAGVTDFGADGCAVILRGRLEPGDVLAEAGLVVQPKAPKQSAAAVAA